MVYTIVFGLVSLCVLGIQKIREFLKKYVEEVLDKSELFDK